MEEREVSDMLWRSPGIGAPLVITTARASPGPSASSRPRTSAPQPTVRGPINYLSTTKMEHLPDTPGTAVACDEAGMMRRWSKLQ